MSREQIFVHTLEEFNDLECEYNLEFAGMSGTHIGYKWYFDDDAKVDVYLKIDEEIEE